MADKTLSNELVERYGDMKLSMDMSLRDALVIAAVLFRYAQSVEAEYSVESNSSAVMDFLASMEGILAEIAELDVEPVLEDV